MAEKFNKVSDGFVCQYCLSESKFDKIQFRSINEHLKEIPDKKKIQFWNDLLKCNPSFVLPPAFSPRIRYLGLQSINNKAGHSVPIVYVDEGLYCTDKRLCPICHNDLPENVGFVNTANILVIGDDSMNSLNLVKNMFNSLLKECDIENTAFYVSNQTEWKKLNENGLNHDISYLFGKIVLFSPKGKTNIEVTVTYYPLGLREIDNISKSQMSRFLTNSNGIIFVSDYDNLFCDEYSSSCLEQYLFKIKDILGMSAHDNSAIPVSVAFTGIEKLKGKSEINIPNIDVNYHSDVETSNNITQNILMKVSNRTLQNIRAVFSNSFLSSVPDDSAFCKNNDLIYQNPIKWIFQANNYMSSKQNNSEKESK